MIPDIFLHWVSKYLSFRELYHYSTIPWVYHALFYQGKIRQRECLEEIEQCPIILSKMEKVIPPTTIDRLIVKGMRGNPELVRILVLLRGPGIIPPMKGGLSMIDLLAYDIHAFQWMIPYLFQEAPIDTLRGNQPLQPIIKVIAITRYKIPEDLYQLLLHHAITRLCIKLDRQVGQKHSIKLFLDPNVRFRAKMYLSRTISHLPQWQDYLDLIMDDPDLKEQVWAVMNLV